MIREVRVKNIQLIISIYNDVIINTVTVMNYPPHMIDERTGFEKSKESRRE